MWLRIQVVFTGSLVFNSPYDQKVLSPWNFSNKLLEIWSCIVFKVELQVQGSFGRVIFM